MSSVNAPETAKEFDARTAALVLGDDDQTSDVEDIESFGYDLSKAHEKQSTIDQNAIWVKSTPEITGSFVMKETSPDIERVIELWLSDTVLDITTDMAEDSALDSMHFLGVIITDVSHSDYQIDDMPTITADWEGVNVDINTGDTVGGGGGVI